MNRGTRLLLAFSICALLWGTIGCGTSHDEPTYADGLRLHYTFEKDQETTVIDHSGRENHGRIIGELEYVEGIQGKAVRIKDSNAFIQTASKDLSWTDWEGTTIGAWVKPIRDTAYGTILARSDPFDGGDTSCRLAIGNSWAVWGTFMAHKRGIKPTRYGLDHPDRPPLQTWVFLLGTSDGEIARFYIDGEFDKEGSEYPGLPQVDTPSQVYTIGRDRGYRETWKDSHFEGDIDEVMIWNRVLTLEEIKTLAARFPKPPKNAP